MRKSPEKTGTKRDGRFNPGQSGNPSGRPQGARHSATVAALDLLDGWGAPVKNMIGGPRR